MSDQRELRERLEAAQGDVKRLKAELAAARAPKARGVDPEVRVAQLEQRNRELETWWRARETEDQQRERALRDEVDALKAEIKALKSAHQRSERQLKAAFLRIGRLQQARAQALHDAARSPSKPIEAPPFATPRKMRPPRVDRTFDPKRRPR